jgi:alkylation response protein AidB-like acyl-CoA dehydrogenase
MPDDSVWIDRARELGARVFGPAAMQVEAAHRVPPEHLDLLAAEGFYGLAGPREAGGLDLPFPAACRIIEILAGACLSTTFVWMQHHGVVRAVAGTDNAALRQRMLGPLCRGERRAGVALAGLLPGPPRLRARPTEGGYVLDGTSPWVTGWDYLDTLHVAARQDDGTIVWAVLDAGRRSGVRSSLSPEPLSTIPEPLAITPEPLSITPEPLAMVAVMASSTVQLHFAGHPVPQDRVTGTLPLDQWRSRDAAALRANGSLALGLTARCCELIGPGPLDEQLARCRTALDTADPDAMPGARAAACELALRATAALVVTQGSGAILADHDAQRLAREALFLLVFGSRPPIREALAGLLTRPG